MGSFIGQPRLFGFFMYELCFPKTWETRLGDRYLSLTYLGSTSVLLCMDLGIGVAHFLLGMEYAIGIEI